MVKKIKFINSDIINIVNICIIKSYEQYLSESKKVLSEEDLQYVPANVLKYDTDSTVVYDFYNNEDCRIAIYFEGGDRLTAFFSISDAIKMLRENKINKIFE